MVSLPGLQPSVPALATPSRHRRAAGRDEAAAAVAVACGRGGRDGADQDPVVRDQPGCEVAAGALLLDGRGHPVERAARARGRRLAAEAGEADCGPGRVGHSGGGKGDGLDRAAAEVERRRKLKHGDVVRAGRLAPRVPGMDAHGADRTVLLRVGRGRRRVVGDARADAQLRCLRHVAGVVEDAVGGGDDVCGVDHRAGAEEARRRRPSAGRTPSTGRSGSGSRSRRRRRAPTTRGLRRSQDVSAATARACFSRFGATRTP